MSSSLSFKSEPGWTIKMIFNNYWLAVFNYSWGIIEVKLNNVSHCSLALGIYPNLRRTDE